jgi:hypothetical protein
MLHAGAWKGLSPLRSRSDPRESLRDPHEGTKDTQTLIV